MDDLNLMITNPKLFALKKEIESNINAIKFIFSIININKIKLGLNLNKLNIQYKKCKDMKDYEKFYKETQRVLNKNIDYYFSIKNENKTDLFAEYSNEVKKAFSTLEIVEPTKDLLFIKKQYEEILLKSSKEKNTLINAAYKILCKEFNKLRN